MTEQKRVGDGVVGVRDGFGTKVKFLSQLSFTERYGPMRVADREKGRS